MVIAALATLLIAALIIMFVFSRKLVKEEALQDARQTLESTVQRIDNILLDVELASGNIYWKLLPHINEPDVLQRYTQKLTETNPYISDSQIIWDTDSDAIDAPMACWSEPSKVDNGIVSFLLPLFDKQQKVGVLKADVSLEKLSTIVLETKPSPNSYCTLLGKRGSFIIHPDNKQLNLNVLETSGQNVAMLATAEAMLSGESGYKYVNVRGKDYYVFYRPFERAAVEGRAMADLGWSVALIYAENDIFGDYNKLLYYVLVIAIVGLVLMFILCRTFIHRQFVPLRELEKSAKLIADGCYDETIPYSRHRDEIGRLQNHFHQMQQSLSTHMREMEQLTGTLRERGEVLQAAYEQAEGADRMKTNFLYNMSTQMISPVSTICQSVMTICDHYDELSEEETNNLVNEIKQQGGDVTALLNQLISDSENVMNKG